MYLNQVKKKVTLSELADQLRISRNNLIKASNQLAKMGLIETKTGRFGGLKLKEGAERVTLKEIIKQTEENFNLAGCFPENKFACTFLKGCQLKVALQSAIDTFLDSLGQITLDDITPKGRPLSPPRPTQLN